MLIGRGLVERSFSQYEEEERLYSTGNDELDDLLERAFCDGYQYAQVEFAEKEDKEDKWSDKDDSSMKLGDKVSIWGLKKLHTKKGREAIVEGHRHGNWHKEGVQNAKIAGGVGALGGAIVGAGVTPGGAGKKALGAAAGAAAAGGLLGGATYAGTRVGGGLKNVANELSRGSAEKSARRADRADVASGKMTKEEYLKRRSRRGR